MASSARRIVTQTMLQAMGKVAGIGLGVAAVAIITRHLGVAGYGWYAAVMAYLQLAGVAVDLGLNVLAPTALATAHADAESRGSSSANGRDALAAATPSTVLSNIFTMRLAAGVVAFTIAAVGAWLIPSYPGDVRVGIAVATIGFLAIVCTQIVQVPFQVTLDMRWPTVAELLGRAVLVLGVAVAAWRGAGLLAVVAATVLGNLVGFAVTFLAARRRIDLHFAVDREVWRAVAVRSWPIALSILFNLVYLRADHVLLSFLRPAEDLGRYAAPYRLLDVVTQLPHLVMGLVLPTLAAAWAVGDRTSFHRRLQRTFDGLALLAFPIVAGSIVLGTPIMTFIAGDAFAVSGPILAVLSVALLGIFLGQPFGYGVVAVGQQRRMLGGYAAVAVATLLGYLVFIPTYSYWAAASLTVASEFAIAALTYVVVHRTSGFVPNLRVSGAALLASAGMAAAVAVVDLPIAPRAAVGIIAYTALAYAFPPTRAILRVGFSRSPTGT